MLLLLLLRLLLLRITAFLLLLFLLLGSTFLLLTGLLLLFLELGRLNLLQLFELRLGRLRLRQVREASHHAESLDLLEHARQVLDVVKPAERVGQVELLKVHEFAKRLSESEKHDNVGGGDVTANEEHSHRQVRVEVRAHGFAV